MPTAIRAGSPSPGRSPNRHQAAAPTPAANTNASAANATTCRGRVTANRNAEPASSPRG